MCWYLGILGHSFYALPFIIFLILTIHHYVKNSLYEMILNDISVLKLNEIKINKNIILIFCVINGLIWISIYSLRMYNFSIMTIDTGLYSSVIYNLSIGEIFHSYFNVNPLGDHFVPNLFIFAFLYKIYPTPLWILYAKAIAYAWSGWCIYKLIVQQKLKSNYKNLLVYVTVLMWFNWYSPLIHSVSSEFHPSSLALPFIILCYYYLQRKNWIIFFMIMVFLLGFKDHLSVVWIGFGLHMILTKIDLKKGIILTTSGILWIYLIFYHILPFFRDGLPAWNGVNSIDPFNELTNKLKYLVMLFFPFGFLHVWHIKQSIIAAPAIGVWLISFGGLMISTKYHYDDIPSVLLFISFVLILKDLKFTFVNKIKDFKLIQLSILFIIVLIFYNLPHNSPIRYFYDEIPITDYRPIHQEIDMFTKETKNERVALSNVIGPHVQKFKKELISQDIKGNCMKRSTHWEKNKNDEPQYYVFAEDLKDTQIWNMKMCIQQFENNPNYIRIDKYKYIDVFKTMPN